MSYYTAKIILSFETDKGDVKKKNETYLVEAESVTDAEAKMYKEFETYKSDWEVVAIVQTKIVKIVQ